jgi:sodium/potassium-transporting ATPase subunit alpha
LLNGGLLVHAYLFLGVIEAIGAMSTFVYVLVGAGWQWGEQLASTDLAYRQATTACLTAIVLMQVVNVHLCRSRRASLWSLPLFNNRLITIGIAAELALILLIDYTAIGNRVFGTAPIPASAWLFIMPFAVAMLGFEEIRKAVARGIHSSRGSPISGTRAKLRLRRPLRTGLQRRRA